MLAYSTGEEGIGGSLRASPGDFVVSELLRPAALSMITPGGRGGYPVYVMRKSGIDTNHAIARIRARSGLRLRALGLKDAAADTSQYVFAAGRRGPRPGHVEAGSVRIDLVGSAPRPLSGADMEGNRFTIRVSGASGAASRPGRWRGSIANYYGYQRFGSARPVSHLIGRALLLGDYGRAVSLLLSFTSPHDTAEHSELRRMMADPANYARAAAALPRGMDLERTALAEMIRHGDARRAAAALPVAMRRFFAQAYQSYLFNMAASSLLGSGEDMFNAREGDVCYGPDGELGRHADAGAEAAAGGAAPAAAPAVPLAGYAHYKKTRFEAAVSGSMEADGVGPHDFLAKDMPEIGLEGGFRSAAARCTGVEAAGDDTVSFTLGRGSYATVVMREVVKPADPHSCGF